MTKKLSAKFVFVNQENKKLAQKTHLANFYLCLMGQTHLARSRPRAEKTEKNIRLGSWPLCTKSVSY